METIDLSFSGRFCGTYPVVPAFAFFRIRAFRAENLRLETDTQPLDTSTLGTAGSGSSGVVFCLLQRGIVTILSLRIVVES